MRLTALCLLIPAGPLLAQTSPSKFELTIANIMRGPEVYGREPQRPRFTPDGKWIYFSWLPPGTDWREPLKPYRVRAQAGAVPEEVTRAHMDSVTPLLDGVLPLPQVGGWSPDRRRRVVSENGDLFVVEPKTSTAQRLTDTPTIAETNPSFSADGKTVYFVREGQNLMALELSGPVIRQLTDVRPGPAPADSSKRTAQQSALEAQQRGLFEPVRDRLRQDSIAKAEREARQRTRTLYLRPNERITGLSVSPAGNALVLTTTISTS